MLTPAVATFMTDSIVNHKGTDSELSDRTYDIILELNRMQPQMLLEVLVSTQAFRQFLVTYGLL